MKCWVGIDLGSTTTKAVILDEGGALLGRGITNSRNNYDAACAIARTEAFVDARFALVRRGLHEPVGNGGPADSPRGGSPAGLVSIRPLREPFVSRLARAFRLEQYRLQLGLLRSEALLEADARADRGGSEGLVGAVSLIFDAMEMAATRLFAPGAPRGSDFFKDISGSQYLALAERSGADDGIPFESLAGIFDKSILKVENSLLDLSFEAHAGAAVEQALAGDTSLTPEERHRLRERVDAAAALPLEEASSVGTGYGRARLPFPRERIRSEILCHGLGAHALFPSTATVLDIGGQDTKAIQVDEQGIVTSFQMNDRCAAGCGRYLGYIADEMSLGLHELGPLAETSKVPVKISSTCTVFAGAEIRDRLSVGQKREDILAGLHRAIILRAMALLARSGGIRDEFTFTGGVAKNPAAVAALDRLVRENYGERRLNISADSIYTGALGAALFAMKGATSTPVDGEIRDSRGTGLPQGSAA